MIKLHDDEKEMVKSLIREIYSLIGDTQITRSALQKIIFLYTRQLSSENPIKKLLPFYWFYKGPTSDVFQQIYDEMLLSKEIIKVTKAEDLNIYKSNKNLKSYVNTNFININNQKTSLEDIINYYKEKGFDSLLERCYDEFGPFAFSKLFNMRFRKKYDTIYSAILAERENEWKIGIPEACGLLDACVQALPQNIEFDCYNYYFRLFSDCFHRGFKSDRFLEDKTVRRIFSTHTNEIRNDIWKNFEEIVRLLDKIGHDSGYEDKIEEWKLYADDTIKLLAPTIFFYFDYVNNNFPLDNNTQKTIINKESLNKDHISLIVLEWIAKNELPKIGFEWELEHLKTGCIRCNQNLSDYRELIA